MIVSKSSKIFEIYCKHKNIENTLAEIKTNGQYESDLLNYLVQISSSLENDKSLLIDKNTKTSGNLVTDTNDLLKFTNISEISDSSFNYNSRSNDETESNYSSLS